MNGDGTLGVGVIGCGWAAGEVVRAIDNLPELHVSAVCDEDGARAAEFALRTGAPMAPDIDTLLQRGDVDLAYVGLPHALIAPTVRRALLAGKHVLAEKPLALDGAEARDLGRLAIENKRTLSVFFELRRSATVQAARQMIIRGDIGEPRLVRLRTIIDKPAHYWGSSGRPNWRASRAVSGGGVLLMNTVHQLDTLRYLTGLDFQSAQGEVATFSAPGDAEDTASATLRLSNGAIVSIVAAAQSPGARDEETIEIDGTGGRMDLPDTFGEAPLRVFRRGAAEWQAIEVARIDSHLHMLKSVATAVIQGAEMPAGAEDAAAVVDVINAVYRSARDGRLVEIGGS